MPRDYENETNGKWYLNKNGYLVYYTPFVITKEKYFFHGDGSSLPTPCQKRDLIEDLSSQGYEANEYGNGLFTASIPDRKKEVDLPAGIYQYQSSAYPTPEKLVPFEFRNDTFVKTNDVYQVIIDDIKSFISNKDVYRKIGCIYKRGLLLYGPPGEGKTSLIREIVKKEIPEDSIVIAFTKGVLPTASFMNAMKDSLKDRLKILIFEELVDFMRESSLEELLTFLDGEFSLDSSLIIATTNYPEQLPGNIVDRPSRFDKLYKIESPNDQERNILLKHYLLRDAAEEEIKLTDKLSTAAIKEAAIMVHLKSISFQEAVDSLRKHSEIVKKHFQENKKTMGF